jgi:hypothetical protein
MQGSQGVVQAGLRGRGFRDRLLVLCNRGQSRQGESEEQDEQVAVSLVCHDDVPALPRVAPACRPQ